MNSIKYGEVIYEDGDYLVAPQKKNSAIICFQETVYEVVDNHGPLDGGPELIAVCPNKDKAIMIAQALAYQK